VLLWVVRIGNRKANRRIKVMPTDRPAQGDCSEEGAAGRSQIYLTSSAFLQLWKPVFETFAGRQWYLPFNLDPFSSKMIATVPNAADDHVAIAEH
jgi:hypothetical protein